MKEGLCNNFERALDLLKSQWPAADLTENNFNYSLIFASLEKESRGWSAGLKR